MKPNVHETKCVIYNNETTAIQKTDDYLNYGTRTARRWDDDRMTGSDDDWMIHKLRNDDLYIMEYDASKVDNITSL
jgi:hypothetical protein